MPIWGIPIDCNTNQHHAVIVYASIAALLVAVGCTDPGGSGRKNGSFRLFGRSESPNGRDSALTIGTQDHKSNQSTLSQQETVIVRQISFDILRARVAKGIFSESGKIWNHLDEEALPADTAFYLQRNGLRVARGKLDSWRPIKALLEQEKNVESSAKETPLTTGASFTLELDPRPRDQTLFIVRRNGHLAGADYADSVNLLRIEYGFSVDNKDLLVVRMMPQIKLPYTASRFDVGPNGLVQYPSHQPTKVLRELAFEMELGPDEFFVIGPSNSAHHGHLAGSLLLCEEIEGSKYESMYFITPQVTEKKRVKPVLSRQTGSP
ncbi:MAG: hypothetical protein JSV03_03850 [Planctomycetota bacterium]|nr:MAG: hypothetical protein JSV03_03850 [Planctomycetota bacterium]